MLQQTKDYLDYINKIESKLTECKYDWLQEVSQEGLTQFILNNKDGFINEEGEEFFFIEDRYIDSRKSVLQYAKYKDTLIFKTDKFFGEKEKFMNDIEEYYEDFDYVKDDSGYVVKRYGGNSFVNECLAYVNEIETRISNN